MCVWFILRYSPSRMMKILIFVQIYILNNHINHRNTRSHSEGLATWFGALVLMAWTGHQSIGIYPLCLESLMLRWPQTIYHWRFQQESSRWPTTSCSCFATHDRNQQAVSAFVRPHYLVLSKSTPMCCWKTTTKQSCNYRRTEMWSNPSWLVCNPIPIMWKFPTKPWFRLGVLNTRGTGWILASQNSTSAVGKYPSHCSSALCQHAGPSIRRVVIEGLLNAFP